MGLAEIYEWQFLYFDKKILKFVPDRTIDNKSTLVPVMVWRQTEHDQYLKQWR